MSSRASRATPLSLFLCLVLALSSCASATPAPQGVDGSPTDTRLSGTASPAGGDPCTNGQIELSTGGTLLESGHRVIGFRLRNTSTRTCNAAGYPAVELFNNSGRQLHFRLLYGGTDFGDAMPDPMVMLPPGYDVNFDMQWNEDSSPCFKVAQARLVGASRSIPVTVDRETVAVCGQSLREAAVYKPVYPASYGLSQNEIRMISFSGSGARLDRGRQRRTVRWRAERAAGAVWARRSTSWSCQL